MSNSNISNINKETIKLKKEEKQKDKDKESENLLDDNKNINKEKNKYCNIEDNHERIYFLLLGAFMVTLYLITKFKPDTHGVHQIIDGKIIDNKYFEEPESSDRLNFYDSRFKDLYPYISLDPKKEINSLSQLVNGRVLYIREANLTGRYLRHIRPFGEHEEEKFKPQLYKNLVPNDTFSENRQNLYKSEDFINLCNQEKLISNEKITASNKPLISIIIPVYNKRNEITKTIRSIQNQSMKNIEIIIVDDYSTESAKDIYDKLLKSDPRIRVFYHLSNMGTFKSRLDGFLYSRGKYTLHFDPGDLFADNLILEDVYNMIIKYNLDSIRFAFKKYKVIGENNYEISLHTYPSKDLKIKYGNVKHNINIFGYGTIWNRLVRANVVTKGLDLVDSYILNAYKNLWDDLWWNDLINRVSYSHLVINRIGYIYYCKEEREERVKISTDEEKEQTIREFIYFWLFDFQLTRIDSRKKRTIDKLREYSMPNNTYNGIPINLDYLNSNFTVYNHLLNVLIEDYFVFEADKKFVIQLRDNYTEKLNKTNYF